MSDAGVVLPPELRAALQPAEGRASRLGTALPSRPPDQPSFDNAEIVLDLGDVTVSIGGDEDAIGAPYIKENPEPPPFGENLAISLADKNLPFGTIASQLIQGVEADELSRSQWTDQYKKGMDLLGLKIEEIANRSQRRNVSRVGHPLMIEAMVKYQAGAEAELLPAMGPVKVPTVGSPAPGEEELAKAFEDDFNYYLTEVAKEYYPDTSRMLMHQAFCGVAYKKVYRCPIRRRPVSEMVLAPDLIVSDEATDLDNALRVTHAIQMLRSQLKRMQIVGQYRDVNLGTPGALTGIGGSAQRAIKESEGISPNPGTRPEDQPYHLLEVDTDLDVDELGIDGYYERRTPDGLMLPYKVAVERNTREVLGIWRNWDPNDDLCRKQNMYVKYGLVPGLGFYDWGFLQLLGNQTRALRAIWRLLIDAGMFSNFPGGMKSGRVRTGTNEIAPGPGEWVDLDVPTGTDLTKSIIPMPYKGPDSVFIQLSEIIKNDAMRLGGSTLLEVGEGRANVPVGTILAMLEDKVQVMAQVYKRNHRSQKEELRKLRLLFADDPMSLTLMCRERPRSSDAAFKQWQRAEEFMDLNLIPASDPNVPSQAHRNMVANVMVLLAQQVPQYFDVPAVLEDAVRTIGKDPARYVIRPDQTQGAPQPPDPRVMAATIKQQTDQAKAQTEAVTQQARLQVEREKLAVEAEKSAADNQTAMNVAHVKAATDTAQPYHEAAAAPEPPVSIGG
jgi:hypothetical protein